MNEFPGLKGMMPVVNVKAPKLAVPFEGVRFPKTDAAYFLFPSLQFVHPRLKFTISLLLPNGL